MKLPNGELAIVDAVKLTEYCLSLDHPRGRHKARVFEAALGITSADADYLRFALLAAARDGIATAGVRDDFGQRYVLDFDLEGPSGAGRVRSTWIIRADEVTPRLTSCYVL